MTTESIVLGGGCFWCIEAIFQRVKGITKTVSGYAGGEVVNPSYKNVCSGTTGHAEVVEITFDKDIIQLSEILDIFFHLHDPTTLNRQGADKGTQYRSVVYFTNTSQEEVTQEAIKKVQPDWSNKIVTELKPLDIFYVAESYHQDYFNQHSGQGYCQIVISPKLAKLKEKYFEKLV